MRTWVSMGIVVAALLAGGVVLRSSPGEVDEVLERYERARTRLAIAINEQRAEEGLGPLMLEPRLTRAAQEVALAIAGRMKAEMTFEQAIRDGEVEERLAAAGYETHAYAVRFAVVADVPDVATRLMADRRELRRKDLPELGIGMAPSWRSRIYVLVAALSAGDHFAAETAELEDLERVRARFLDLLNQARLESNVRPVTPDACLVRVAQTHAERMLAEGFVAHTAPEGGGLEARARAGGCPHQALGEAMAKGQTSVDEIVEEWLASPEHRGVLLEPGFDATGLGLAIGRGPDGYATIWVQLLGKSSAGAP